MSVRSSGGAVHALNDGPRQIETAECRIEFAIQSRSRNDQGGNRKRARGRIKAPSSERELEKDGGTEGELYRSISHK